VIEWVELPWPTTVPQGTITWLEVVNVVVDPGLETADVNVSNNTFPKKPSVNKFDQLKKGNQ